MIRRPKPMTPAGLATAPFLILWICGILCGCSRRVDQSVLDNDLLKAVQSGKTESVRQLLRKGANVNVKNHNGDTALLVIASRRHGIGFEDPVASEITRLLLDDGANLEARDKNGSTPLIIAAQNDLPDVVRLLLDRGASVDTADHNGGTALTEAASEHLQDVVAILLDRIRDTRATNQALLAAITEAPRVLSITQLPVPPLSSRPKIVVLDAPPKVPPVANSSAGWPDAGKTVKLLLDKGANIETRDWNGQTPLIRAAAYGQHGIMKVLLEGGADIEAHDDDGQTALIAAACGGCSSIDEGDTLDSVRVLLERHADVEAKDKRGHTALMVAASYGRADIVKMLLDRGAKVDDRNSDGSTALILAAPSGASTATGMVFTVPSLRVLLDHHSDVNATNKRGQTALIMAVSERDATEADQVVRLLLSRGANASVRDVHGKTAHDLARKNGYPDAAKLLERAVP
jgi:ankyrin repeat protein